MSELAQQKCVPCEVKIPPFSEEEAKEHLEKIDGWKMVSREDELRINKVFTFKDFAEAMVFVNKVAEIAESEGHHPDIHIHYNEVTIELWTHFIEGLHSNDFIVAAKIDQIS